MFVIFDAIHCWYMGSCMSCYMNVCLMYAYRDIRWKHKYIARYLSIDAWITTCMLMYMDVWIDYGDLRKRKAQMQGMTRFKACKGKTKWMQKWDFFRMKQITMESYARVKMLLVLGFRSCKNRLVGFGQLVYEKVNNWPKSQPL